MCISEKPSFTGVNAANLLLVVDRYGLVCYGLSILGYLYPLNSNGSNEKTQAEGTSSPVTLWMGLCFAAVNLAWVVKSSHLAAVVERLATANNDATSVDQWFSVATLKY